MFIARGCAFLILLALCAGPASAGERVRVAYSAISGATVPIWVTKDAGLFEKHGLDVELMFVEGGSRNIAALLAGDVAMAHLGGSSRASATSWRPRTTRTRFGSCRRSRTPRPEQFLELRFLRELDESGFIDRLYRP